jgi:hypothetical protein
VLSWSFMNNITSTSQCTRSSVVLNTSRISEIEDLHNLFTCLGQRVPNPGPCPSHISRRSFGGLGSKLDAINTPLTGVSLQYLVTRHSHSGAVFLHSRRDWLVLLILATGVISLRSLTVVGLEDVKILIHVSRFIQTTCR